MNPQGNASQEGVPSSLFADSNQNLPTADSLFGGSASFLSQLGPKPFPPNATTTLRQAAPPPMRPPAPRPFHNPHQQRPTSMHQPPAQQQNQLPHHQLPHHPRPHAPYQQSQDQPAYQPGRPSFQGRPQFQGRPPFAHQAHQRPPFHHPQRPPQQRPPQQGPRPSFHPSHPPTPPSRPPSLPPNQTAGDQLLKPNRSTEVLFPSTSTVLGSTPDGFAAALSPVLSPKDLPRRLSKTSEKYVPPSPVQHRTQLQPQPQQTRADTTVLSPKPPPLEPTEPPTDKDLPSADVLFGGPSSFDLFQAPQQRVVEIPPRPTLTASIPPSAQTESSLIGSTTPRTDTTSDIFARQEPAEPTETHSIQSAPDPIVETKSTETPIISFIDQLDHIGILTQEILRDDDQDKNATEVSTGELAGIISPEFNEDASASTSDLFATGISTQFDSFPDSSSLFGGSDATDTSQLFGGPSVMESSLFFSEISHSGSSDRSKKEGELLPQLFSQELDNQNGNSVTSNSEVKAATEVRETPTEAPQRTSEAKDPVPSLRESQRPPNSFKSPPSKHHYEGNSLSSFSSRAMELSSQRDTQRHQYSSAHVQHMPPSVKSAHHESSSLSLFTDSRIEEAPPAATMDQEPDISGVHATHAVSDMLNNSDLPWSNSYTAPSQKQSQDFKLLQPSECHDHVFAQSTDARLVLEQPAEQPLDVPAAHGTFSPPSTLPQSLPPWETQPPMPLNDQANAALSATETAIAHDFLGAHTAFETTCHTQSFEDNSNHVPFFESTSNPVPEHGAHPIFETASHISSFENNSNHVPFFESVSNQVLELGTHPIFETASHIPSFGNNSSHVPFFESISNQMPEQPIESTHTEATLDVASRDHSIPFDSSLSGPSSPIFDREPMASFTSPGQRPSITASEYQTSSYSIMELASPMEPSQFFVQARQSPLLLDQFADLGSASHVPSQSALEHPGENDVSSFDQVSLAEDLSGPTPAQAQTTHVSAPVQQKERGLASLFDPATLGAVEDLLNMPKSAAFERGMNRLFKGVKSSASSMFASPLTQSPSVPTDTSPAQNESTYPHALTEGSSGASTTTLESQVPSTQIQDQALKDTLPPPPRRIDNGPPAAANMPRRESVIMQSSEAASAESHPSTGTEVTLPPPPRAEYMQVKNSLSPKLEGKSHKPPRVPRMQHDWAPKQPMFVDIESEVAQQESGDESATHPPEVQQSKDEHDLNTDGSLPQEQSLEQGLSKLFGGIREAWRGNDRHETSVNTTLWNQPTEAETRGPFDEHLGQQVQPYAQDANTEASTGVQQKAATPFGDAAKSEPPLLTVPHENHSFLPPQVQSPHTSTQEQPLNQQAVLHSVHPLTVQHESQIFEPHVFESQVPDHPIARRATPDLLRREHSPILQRSASPSVLDKNVLLRKQSVVSAIIAEQQTSSSSSLRANPDTKGKLLEKARGLLEKRQRISGQQHHQRSASPGKSLGSPSQSSFNVGLRRESEISQDSASLLANSNQVFYNGRPSVESTRSSMEFSSVLRNGQRTPSVSSPLLSNTQPQVTQEHQPFSPPAGSLSAFQQPEFQSTQRITEENESLKKQIQLLSAELDLSRRDAQTSLQATQEELHKEIGLLQSTLKQAEERNAEQRSSESRHLLELENANQKLRHDLNEARRRTEEKQSEEHSHSAQIELLKQQNHLLIQQLTEVQGQLESQQQHASDNGRIAELEADNEDLRSELELAQRQIREQMQKVLASPTPVSITLDGTSYTPEQLSKEAEGLRRQLKGQRADIKEMQDLVKRAENEKRDFQAKIEQLEHSLASSERLR
ncbi:MAG: hypothetical protein BYD32DRAFT_404538 [Podila humilis]|nr:MAG: hypothetical protein BYD32DRAFT_404538 [Podila humilis]